jgi:hypothetical protein
MKREAILSAALLSLLLLTISSSSQSTGISSKPFQVLPDAAAASFPEPQWSGEFEWSYAGAFCCGQYTESGSASFTFTVTPGASGDWNVTGSGTASEQYKVVGNQGYCSGSGGGSFSFQVGGDYDTYDNNFTIGNVGPFSPANFTFPETPASGVGACNPATQYFDLGGDFGWDIPAEDGATLHCSGPPSLCPTDTYVTENSWKVTIHGSTTTSTTSPMPTTSTLVTSTSTVHNCSGGGIICWKPIEIFGTYSINGGAMLVGAVAVGALAGALVYMSRSKGRARQTGS